MILLWCTLSFSNDSIIVTKWEINILFYENDFSCKFSPQKRKDFYLFACFVFEISNNYIVVVVK